MDSIGILCRGKSLERLPEVADKFDTCFIINDWQREMALFENLLERKQIIHFLNADMRSLLDEQTCARLRINEGVMGWTKRHTEPGRGKKNIRKVWKKISGRFGSFSFMPNRYYEECSRIGNTGLMCLLHVSDLLSPDVVYVVGLDFFSCRHLVMKMTQSQGARVHNPENVERLTRQFVRLAGMFPLIKYKLITYHDGGGLPLPENVEVL